MSAIEKATSKEFSESVSWNRKIERRKNGHDSVRAWVLPEDILEKAATNALLPRQVFIPGKEMISLFKGLVGLFEKYSEFPLNETYKDLAISMSTLEPRDRSALHAMPRPTFKSFLGGDLTLEDGDISFKRENGTRLKSRLFPHAADPADAQTKLRQMVRAIDPHALCSAGAMQKAGLPRKIVVRR